MKFIDTEETLGFGGQDIVDAKCRELDGSGWTAIPYWLPVPLAGYKYELPGMIYAYMKPKPRLRHILRYKFIPNWWRKLRAKIWVKNMFKELRKT